MKRRAWVLLAGCWLVSAGSASAFFDYFFCGSIAPQEGQALSGVTVGTGRNSSDTCYAVLGSIDWGDGSTSGATISCHFDGVTFDVLGDHTYAEEGSYTVTVTVQDFVDGTTASCSQPVTVSDAPLSATGLAVQPALCTPLTGTVATFTDANPNGAPSDFAATIDWGDAGVSAGTITANGGGFDVSGTHTYMSSGVFPVQVSIADVGGSTANASGTATVAGETITAPSAVCALSSGNTASVPDGGAGATYAWTITGGTITGGDGTPAVTFAAGASGAITLGVTMQNAGCVSTGSANVAIDPSPSAAITAPASVCAGSAGSPASVPDAGAGAGYAWTITNGTITGGGGAPAVTFTPGASGTVGLGVTVTNSWACAAMGNQSVPINPVPAPPTASNSGPICAGQTLGLSAATIAGASYSWFGPNGFTSSLQNPSIPNAATSASGTYSVTATVNGCTSSAGTTAATVNPNPAPVITVSGCLPPNTSGLTASVPANAGDTYAWTITGGTIDSGQGTDAISFTSGGPATLMTLSIDESNGTCSGAASETMQADFNDVPSSNPFYNFICTIARNGITAGCGGGDYCPAADVLRSQMAVFILRGEHGSVYVPPPAVGIFADILPSNPFAPWIEELYNESITGGCSTNPLMYCPNNAVSRAGMAVFLLVAEHGTGYVPPACTGIFTDVACPSAFADWIEQLYNEGVTGGCNTNPLQYCPANSVTRAQMSVFLTVTFALP